MRSRPTTTIIYSLNHRYQIRIVHKPKESYKSNPKVATHQERANHQTAKPRSSGNKIFLTIPIATHKYKTTKPRHL